MMQCVDTMLTRKQERELEKVNAFYLQKEAEVDCGTFLLV